MKNSWDELLFVLQPQLISKPSFKFSSEATAFGGPEQAKAAEEIKVDWESKTNMNGKEENKAICEGMKKRRMTKSKSTGEQRNTVNAAFPFDNATINRIRHVES